jgi:hypothetical protein
LSRFVTERTSGYLDIPDTGGVTGALYRRLGQSVVAELVAAYEAGASSAALADQYGVSRSGVKQLLHVAGANVRTPVGLSADQVDEASALYEQGLLLREIGELLGFHKDTVRRALIRHGVVMRSGHGDHSGSRS